MDKSKRIEIEVKKIHKKIKRSNVLLRERMQDIQEEMKNWDLLGETDEERNGTSW